MTINDVFTNAVQCAWATNCWGYDVTVNVNTVRQNYTQWQLEWANSTNGGCQNCTITSVNMVPGFESFASTGTQWLSPTGKNAAFSLNNVGGWKINNANLLVDTGGTVAPVWTVGQGLVQITTNTGSDLVGPGGTISNMTITAIGYIDSKNNVENGVNIPSGLISNITIDGLTYNTPNWASPSTLYGPQAVGSNGLNVSLNNITACATIASGIPTQTRSSIGIANGIVSNSIANVIVAPTQSNNRPCG